MSVGEEGVVSSLVISASVALEIGCSERPEPRSRYESSHPAIKAHAAVARHTAAKRRTMEFIDCPRIQPNTKPAGGKSPRDELKPSCPYPNLNGFPSRPILWPKVKAMGLNWGRSPASRSPAV